VAEKTAHLTTARKQRERGRSLGQNPSFKDTPPRDPLPPVGTHLLKPSELRTHQWINPIDKVSGLMIQSLSKMPPAGDQDFNMWTFRVHHI
jgi:hypothetical protein